MKIKEKGVSGFEWEIRKWRKVRKENNNNNNNNKCNKFGGLTIPPNISSNFT